MAGLFNDIEPINIDPIKSLVDRIEMLAMGRAPQNEKADNDENVCTAVKNAVPKCIQFKIFD